MRTRSGKDYADGKPNARATAAFTPAPTTTKVPMRTQSRFEQRVGQMNNVVSQPKRAVPFRPAPHQAVATNIATASAEISSRTNSQRPQEHATAVPAKGIQEGAGQAESPTPTPQGRRSEMAPRRIVSSRPREGVRILFHDERSEIVDLTKDDSSHGEAGRPQSMRRRSVSDNHEEQKDTIAYQRGPMSEYLERNRSERSDAHSRDFSGAKRVFSDNGLRVMDLTKDDEPSHEAVPKHPQQARQGSRCDMLVDQQPSKSSDSLNQESQQQHGHAPQSVRHRLSSDKRSQNNNDHISNRMEEERLQTGTIQHTDIKPHHNLPPRPAPPTKPLRASHSQQLLAADGNAETSLLRLQKQQSSGVQPSYAGQASMLSPLKQAIQHSELIMFTLTAARQALEDSKNGRSLPPKYDMNIGERFTYPVTRSYHLGALGRLYNDCDAKENDDVMDTDSFPLSCPPMGYHGSRLDSEHDNQHANTTFRPFQPVKLWKEEEYIFQSGNYKGFPFSSVPRAYIEKIYATEDLKGVLERNPGLLDALFRYRPDDERLQRVAL